jgi:hypothetical protein
MPRLSRDDAKTPGADPTRMLVAVPYTEADRHDPPHRRESPFDVADPDVPNLLGAFSVESFPGVGALSGAHRDAAGFLAYPERFRPRDFWYQDDGVKVWAYRGDFDNWDDAYGLDAVRVAYHSGHGSMDADGVFTAPMGSAWRGNDTSAASTRMRLGDDHARYVFWSAGNSLRVLEGHTPVRTWAQANHGVRMMFGFQTETFDGPDQGANFWLHWRNGEPLSTAWLDAGWDVSDAQTPVVVACGVDRAEALSRLDNEHIFRGDAADTSWWQWRWYRAANSVAREPNTTVPEHPKIAVLAPVSARLIADLGEQFDIDTTVADSAPGTVGIGAPARRLHRTDGLITVHIGGPNHQCGSKLSRAGAVSAGGEAGRRYGLDGEGPLVLDRVFELREAGGPKRGGLPVSSRTVQTIVQYRQCINGIPIVSGGAGVVRVSVANDGTVSRIQSSTRAVIELTDNPGPTAVEPAPDGSGDTIVGSGASPDTALATALGAHLRSALARGGHPSGYSVVPGTREIGYSVTGDSAEMVAVQAIELDFEHGYRKRVWISAPLTGRRASDCKTSCR